MPINTENFRKIFYIISEIQRQKERETEINKRKKPDRHNRKEDETITPT